LNSKLGISRLGVAAQLFRRPGRPANRTTPIRRMRGRVWWETDQAAFFVNGGRLNGCNLVLAQAFAHNI
jgi:hypothetical protein